MTTLPRVIIHHLLRLGVQIKVMSERNILKLCDTNFSRFPWLLFFVIYFFEKYRTLIQLVCYYF